jgi:FkbM family methyltransferase
MKKFAGHALTFVRESSKLYRILIGILAIVVKILPLNVVFMSTHFPIRGQFSIKVFGSKKIDLFAAGDDYLLSTLYWGALRGHSYEKEVTEKLKASLKTGMTFIDVGAHVGITSLIAEKICPNATIVAIEALPAVAERLKLNIKLNNSKIHVVRKALGAEEKRSSFYYYGGIPSSSGFILDTIKTADSTKNVFASGMDITTLDLFWSNSNLKSIDIIKIDVEGYEYEVLVGSTEILKSKGPVVIFESLDLIKLSEISAFLTSLGYTVPVKLIGEAKNITNNCNYFSLPETKNIY